MKTTSETSTERKFGQFIKIMTPAKESDPKVWCDGLRDGMDLYV